MGTMKGAHGDEKHRVEEKPATRESPQQDADMKGSPTKDEKTSATISSTSSSSPSSTDSDLLHNLPLVGSLLGGGGGSGGGGSGSG